MKITPGKPTPEEWWTSTSLTNLEALPDRLVESPRDRTKTIVWESNLPLGVYADAVSKLGGGDEGTWTGHVVTYREEDMGGEDYEPLPGKLGRVYAYEVVWYSGRNHVLVKLFPKGRQVDHFAVRIIDLCDEAQKQRLFAGEEIDLAPIIDPDLGELNQIIFEHADRLLQG